MVHLTLTGYHAGALLCGKPREYDGTYNHAVYAPLHNPIYRAKVCPDCLMVYALEAYDDADEDMPEWVQALREVNP